MYLYKRIPRNWSYFHFVMQVNWGLQRIRNLPKFSGLLRGKRKTKTQVFMTQALDHLNIHSIASPGYTFGYLQCLNRRSKYLNKSSILIFRLLPFNYGISRLSHPGNWYFLICLPGGPLKWRSTQLREQISIFTFGKQPDIASRIRWCLLLWTGKRKRKKKESILYGTTHAFSAKRGLLPSRRSEPRSWAGCIPPGPSASQAAKPEGEGS